MRPDLPQRPNGPPADCPDALRLAAWCDDRLDEADRTVLDVHIAACPRCLELVEGLGVREPMPMGIAPDAVVRSATALMPPRIGWRFIASSLAASIAIVSLGLWMGLRLATATTARTDAGAPTVASRADSFGLFDDGRSDEGSLTDPLELVAARLLDGSTS